MRGKIIKGIAGFYYIDVENQGIYECKAKGAFRNEKIKPLVGDDVELDILDEDKKLGNIRDIYKRKSELIRPAVANIDQALIVFAAAKPEPNFNLLDRFLIIMNRQQVNTTLCFNKLDLVDDSVVDNIKSIYEPCGYKLIFISTKTQEGIEELKEALRGRTTALAGPSGVGKSSILNMIKPDAGATTGDISVKIERGKHTTRHSELIKLWNDTFIFDTPGFSTLYINEFSMESLKDYFIEFEKYEGSCRFRGCVHVNEPDCAVKEALAAGEISKVRYDNYVEMYNELKEKRKW